jgi:hypothetical protein
MFSNRWSTMPVHAFPSIRLPRPDDRAFLDRMPGSNVPVIRQPFAVGDPVPFWAQESNYLGDQLFNRRNDPVELENQADHTDQPLEALREALRKLEAPTEQLERLGLA